MNLFYRLILVSVFCALFVGKHNVVFAQNVEINWGPEFKLSSRISAGSVIGEDEENYYLLKTKYNGLFSNNEYLFERYSMNHKVLKSQLLSTKTPQGKVGDFEEIYQIDDKFILFFSHYDSKQDLNILYATNIDKSGKQDKPVIVDKEPAKKEKKSGSYSFILSEDRKKLLVMRTAAYDKKGTEKFKYIMLKSNLEPLWDKEVELPYKDKNFAINDYVIDEKGNVFLLGAYKVNEKDEFFTFKVFAYDYASDKLEDIKVDFGKSMFIQDIQFFYNKQGLHVVGFYYNQKPGGLKTVGVAGIFYTRINSKTFAVEARKVEAFDKKTLSKFVSDRAAKKGKGVQATYKIKNIIVKDDGKIQMIAENEYVIVTRTTDSKGVTRTTYTYYFLDICVLQFNKEGKIDWVARIPKTQISTNDQGHYSSFLYTSDNNNLYFLYNDNPKNTINAAKKNTKIEDETPKPMKVKKSAIAVATVSSTGEVSRELYSKTKDKGKTAFVPKAHSRMGNNRIWIIGEKGRTTKYGFLTLKGNA